jgi:DtxR family Mn-dependent transcriptional regulator
MVWMGRVGGRGMASSRGQEDGLAAIWVLTQEEGPPRQADVARFLGVRPVTALRALRRLWAQGLVATSVPRVTLTPAGQRRAQEVVYRHQVAEVWLSRLGLSWSEVHAQAHRLEHALSPQVARRLWEELGQPTTCPHGGPIPGTQQEGGWRGQALAGQGPGSYSLVRLSERLEGWPKALGALDAVGIRPGGNLWSHGHTSDGILLEGPRGRWVCPREVAQGLYVVESA